MHILPVIDLMNGQVVRGIAGRRAEYKPMVSKLTTSTDPVGVAQAFREHFGFDEIYVADLDAIAGKAATLDVFDALQRDGFRLWVDAGLRHADDAAQLIDRGVTSVIAGLETSAGPAALAAMLERVGPQRLVFSLDLKAGQPLVVPGAWPDSDPWSIAQQVVGIGVQRLLVLDLAQVGVNAGVSTEKLCRRLRREFPKLGIAAGGGVRGVQDVEAMRNAGADWLLVASALHDGRLQQPALRRPSP